MKHNEPQFKFRLPPEVVSWVERGAQENERSKSAQITFLLKQCMKNDETNEAQPGSTPSSVSDQ